MPNATRVALVLVLSVVLTAVAAWADYQTSYGKGLDALDRSQWTEAAKWFRQAITEQPQAGGKVSAGGRRQTYLPYFQLGMALYRGGKLREASSAWREAAVQGVLTKKMQKIVDQYLFDIEARIAAESESPPPATASRPALSGTELEKWRQQARGQLDRADRQLAALEAPDLQAALAADRSLVARRDRGIAKLGQAKEVFGKAGNKAEAFEDVHERAAEAAGILEGVHFAATRLAIQMQPPEPDPESTVALVPAETPGDPELPGGVEPGQDRGPETPAAGEPAAGEDPQIAGLEDVPPLELPGDQPGEEPADEPGDLPGDESAAEEEEPAGAAAPAAGGPPDFLRTAAIAFFSARYQDVLSALASEDPAGDKARMHSHLFRAAALYALHLLEAGQDATRLAQAEAAVRACRTIDATLRPPAEGFSPSFVRFFESVAN